MTAAFGFIVGGALILLAGTNNRSITEVLSGITSPKASASQGKTKTKEPPTKAPANAPKGLKGNRALGYSMMIAHGWGPKQWPYLDKLWTQESNWDEKAQNPSSGAAGIVQDITGNFHGGAAGQIKWGLNYIAERYGSPEKAWEHEVANNWY